jgi:hypothetical protein
MTQTAGYAQTPLPRKLGIGAEDTVALLGAPEEFVDSLGALPEVAAIQTDLDGQQLFDVIVVFMERRAELAAELGRLRDRMAPACGLWIAWPKKTSGVRTDLSGDGIREIALPTGLVDNKVCAIDDTWTALRLVIRRENR